MSVAFSALEPLNFLVVRNVADSAAVPGDSKYSRSAGALVAEPKLEDGRRLLLSTFLPPTVTL